MVPPATGDSWPWDCQQCPSRTSESMRSGWRCGWLDPEEWTAPKCSPRGTNECACSLPLFVGTPPDEVRLTVRDADGNEEHPICPGYLVQCGAVQEAGLAKLALDKGSLAVFFPGLENAVLEAAAAMTQAFNLHERAEMAQAERERKSG